MKIILAITISAIIIAGCGDDESSGGGSGTFPSFYSLAKESVPHAGTGGSSGNNIWRRSIVKVVGYNSGLRLLSGLSTSYNTNSSDFTTAFSVDQNYIGQVLNDAGPNGPVKSMFVLLNLADSSMEDINSNFSDADGNPTNCTAIASSVDINTPFFDTASNGLFNSWTDTGKYTCYTTNEENGTTYVKLFGRSAVTSPPAGCTDAFEYYVMEGYGSNDVANTEQVATRGATVDISAVKKFYYSGCTKDIKMAFAHSTKYVAGVEFSSRSEIVGNTDSHSFSIRSNYIDADTTYANHITIVGTGVSKKTSTTDSSVNFIMGYRSDNCGTSSNSSSCSTGTDYSFCVKNSGTSNSYEMDSTTSNCSSLESTFGAITPLVRSDIPNGYFAAGTAEFGL